MSASRIEWTDRSDWNPLRDRLDSFIANSAGKRLTYGALIA